MSAPPLSTAPAKRYVASAIAIQGKPGRWYAIWASPGLSPDYVYEGTQPREFDNKGSATVIAMQVLFEALNRRAEGRDNNKEAGVFDKMSSAAFAAGLAKTDISVREFAMLNGTTQKRVLSWIEEDNRGVPFNMWWILRLLEDSKNRSLAQSVARDHFHPEFDKEATDGN